MILNKLWSVDKKTTQPGCEEKGKPLDEQQTATVNILKKKKSPRILYSVVYYVISTGLGVFLLFLLFGAIYELNVCFTCFSSHTERISKVIYDFPKPSKYDDTIANVTKQFSVNSSDLNTKTSAEIYTSTVSTIAVKLNEQPRTPINKEIIPGKEFSPEYAKHDNVYQAKIVDKNLETAHKYVSIPDEITLLQQIIQDFPFKTNANFHSNYETGIPNANKKVYPELFDYFPAFSIHLGKYSMKSIYPTNSVISNQFQNYPHEPETAANSMDVRPISRKHRRIILKKKKMVLTETRNKTNAFNERYESKHSSRKHPSFGKFKAPLIFERFPNRNSETPSSETAETKVTLFQPIMKETGIETNLKQKNYEDEAYYKNQFKTLNKQFIKSSLFDNDPFPFHSEKFDALKNDFLKIDPSLNAEPINYDYVIDPSLNAEPINYDHVINPSKNIKPVNYDYDDGISSEIDPWSFDDHIIQSLPERKNGRYRLKDFKQIKKNFNRGSTSKNDPTFRNKAENSSQIDEDINEKSSLPQNPTNTENFWIKFKLNSDNGVKMENTENLKKNENLLLSKVYRDSPLEGASVSKYSDSYEDSEK